MMPPRLSCIMPTADRRRFVPAAIAQFLEQRRDDAELVILDDGADAIADLIPADPRIRYLRDDTRRVLGEKRNRLCEAARGEIIVHWDDDDWYAPDRLSRQLAAMESSGADIVGIDRLAFLSDDGTRAWQYHWRGRERWVCGGSLAYRRSFWQQNRFPAIRSGEDTRFVLSARGATIHAMPDSDWLIARVHDGNTSPKHTNGGYWTPREAQSLLAQIARWTGGENRPPAPARLANVHALLAHERPECVIDLVRNLRFHDPASPILLYDGSASGGLVDRRLPWARWGVEIVANPRPMKWGALHGFALDCLGHLHDRDFDCMTIVDSDQVMLRRNYGAFLGAHFREIGLLSSDARHHRPGSRIGPVEAAYAERALWQPLLDRFEGGNQAFAHWTFWPGTVIGAACGRVIADLFGTPHVHAIMAASKLWATEEVLFPTFARLLGFPVNQNPCRGDWTQYKRRWSTRDIDTARSDPRTFWMHPVNRVLDDPLRRHLRQTSSQYRAAPPAQVAHEASRDTAIMATMRSIHGWLSDAEAALLLATARGALAQDGAAGHIVEIGSHCGKATILLAHAAQHAEIDAHVTAIDRFDGLTGSREAALSREPATRIRFDQSIAAAGLGPWVSARTGEAPAIALEGPIDLLFVDGFHDYAAVACDFSACEQKLGDWARVAFHDYADYFPGVMAFVDELVASGDWEVEAAVETLRIMRRTSALAAKAMVRDAAVA